MDTRADSTLCIWPLRTLKKISSLQLNQWSRTITVLSIKLMKCHLAKIHILTMLLDKANIKQQVRHWGKMAKQSRTMLKPGNFLLPMGNREILLFANHRFIALGAPQVKEQSFSHQVSVKQMLAIRIKYVWWVWKEVVDFRYSLGYKCSSRVIYLLWVKSSSD